MKRRVQARYKSDESTALSSRRQRINAGRSASPTSTQREVIQIVSIVDALSQYTVIAIYGGR
jgi:hypothetical protein